MIDRREAADLSEGSLLDERQLNRALLARQHLLERVSMPVAGMLEHLVGMQSQVPNDPYIGLWSRLEGFSTDDLSRLMLDREVVRALLMRGTIHLVTARDFLRLRPVMQEFYDRLFPGTAYGPNIRGMDLDSLLAQGRALLEQSPRTANELAKLLAHSWPDRDPASMAQAVRHYLPLVQVPPRGVWGKSHQATWTTVEAWLGRSVDDVTAPDEMILRYLAAFGPVTVADIQTWSRLQGLRAVVDRLRPQLRVFRNERGQELFDVPGAPLPDPATPAPVRFLPGFDNALLSHKDRTRIISEERRKAIGSLNGLFLATYLVDGFVAGTWAIVQAKDRATLTLKPFEQHSVENRLALEEEGARLLAFVSGDVADRQVQVEAPAE